MSNADFGSGEPQSIEELKGRYEKLNQEKSQAVTDLAVATANLNTAKESAKNAYGTDDLGSLQTMLEEWTRENERLRREYELSLDAIESELEKIKSDAGPKV